MSMVIVGGGLAGATAAAELRAGGYDGPVTLFAGEGHLPYERPPLSKAVLLGREQPDVTTVFDANWYTENDVDLRLGVRVTAIDPTDHRVRTSDGAESYERLVLATGSVPRRLALADDSGVPVAYLRTLADSARLRVALLELPRVAVIGTGWIGLEVAAAARTIGCQVTVHGRAAQPLLGVLGAQIGQAFADLHRRHGVGFRLGQAVSPDAVGDADLVVVGIGAVPEAGLAADAGLAVDNGVLVDATLRTSDPDIWAIGDIANQDHPILGRLRVEHWDNAIEQAKVAAHNLLGANEPYVRLPYFFSDQYDLGMEYFGHPGTLGYDRVDIEGDLADAYRAHWVRDDKVVAAMQANDWDSSDEVRASVGTVRAG